MERFIKSLRRIFKQEEKKEEEQFLTEEKLSQISEILGTDSFVVFAKKNEKQYGQAIHNVGVFDLMKMVMSIKPVILDNLKEAGVDIDDAMSDLNSDSDNKNGK